MTVDICRIKKPGYYVTSTANNGGRKYIMVKGPFKTRAEAIEEAERAVDGERTVRFWYIVAAVSVVLPFVLAFFGWYD